MHLLFRAFRHLQSLVFIKPPLAIAEVALCVGAVHLFLCLSVRLSVCLNVGRRNAYMKMRLSQNLNNISYGLYIDFSKKSSLDP